jgi:F420-non-reducing hydrogenase small subunit
MRQFAVLQLSGCAGCEVSLLNASEWLDQYRLAYMPLVSSAYDVPEVDILLVSAACVLKKTSQPVPCGTACQTGGRRRHLCHPGGVASLGIARSARGLPSQAERDLPTCPQMPPDRCRGKSDRYPPGRRHSELFMAVLGISPDFKPGATVCQECGRRKSKEMRPAHLIGLQKGEVLPDICLINQGFLCIGSSTRGGCRALCTRPGYPCVGCRGPSDAFIEKESEEWLSAIHRVFAHMTDIPDEEIDQALRSPSYLCLFQFSDFATGRAPRQKETVIRHGQTDISAQPIEDTPRS